MSEAYQPQDAMSLWWLGASITQPSLIGRLFLADGNRKVALEYDPAWIQTGFAMVILSSALRGSPEETLEAAVIDGASPFQIFWKIMIPQIWGTIAVVWTTITIVVLKVFDIIFAMTNGQWNTEVLANLMFKWMFVNFDNGRGSAIAVIIMLAVLPIMIWNIRRANAEEGTR